MAVGFTTRDNELDALTRGLGELLRKVGRSSSEALTESIAEQLATAGGALGAAVGKSDIKLERFIRARPMTATASAFALGIAVGLLLRRP